MPDGLALGDKFLASEQGCAQGSCISTCVSKCVPLHLMTIRKENAFERPSAHLNASSPPDHERLTSSQNFHLVPLATQVPSYFHHQKYQVGEESRVCSHFRVVQSEPVCYPVCARVSTPGSYTRLQLVLSRSFASFQHVKLRYTFPCVTDNAHRSLRCPAKHLVSSGNILVNCN